MVCTALLYAAPTVNAEFFDNPDWSAPPMRRCISLAWQGLFTRNAGTVIFAADC